MNSQTEQRFFNKVLITVYCWHWTALKSKREKLYPGVLCKDLAKEFNVSDATTRNIKHGRKWRSLL